jgi:peptide/nickel transport system permease protein
MTRYIINRFLQTIPTLIGVSIIAFALLRLTGDPARAVLGDMASHEAVEAYREEHGLNDPLIQQYLRFIGDILHGDFGVSLRYNEPVFDLFLERLPPTLELGLAAMALAIVVGVPVGIFSAIRWNTTWDVIIRTLVLFGQAVPGFYLGLLFIIIFSVNLRLLPTGGRGGLKHLIMPSVALSTFLVALIVRFTRSAVLDVLRQDYIRTARAKGLNEKLIIYRHVLKNALIPLITVIGLQIAILFSGAVVTETIFSWPGVGRFAVQAIYARDFPIVQVVILFMAFVIVFINLIVDIAYAYLDPRIRFD